MSNYKITDAGLRALVEGKLKVERDLADDSIAQNRFKVAYDGMVISRDRIQFVFKDQCFMEIVLPTAGPHDTITVKALDGMVSLTMEN